MPTASMHSGGGVATPSLFFRIVKLIDKDVQITTVEESGVRLSFGRSYGAGSSSPLGRDSADPNTSPKALLRCRKPVLLATFNVCTIRNFAKAHKIAHYASKFSIEILGIQEHRIVYVFEAELLFSQITGHCISTSSSRRNDANAGLLLSDRTMKALDNLQSYSKGVLSAT